MGRFVEQFREAEPGRIFDAAGRRFATHDDGFLAAENRPGQPEHPTGEPLMPPRRSFSRRGSALILVLWCLLLLGMAVFGVVEMVELSVEHTSHEEQALEARGLALSGLALGLSPQLLKDDPLLFQKPAAGRQFKVAIESEGARLNL